MTEQNNKILMVIAIMVYAVIVAFWTLSAGALDNHECLVSVTARETLETGDWILPRFNGEIRLQKTPLCYWLVASVAKVTGEVDEFSSRLPSACFAVISVIAILYFVSQWLGIEIAAISAAVWVSTLAFCRYSQCARPEMALCSLVTISMLSFHSAMQTQSKRHRILYMLVFWLSFALAMLAKGPMPLVLVLPPIFFYFAVFRQWKRIKDTLPIIGPIVFLLIVLPWPIMITAKVPEGWMFWKREFVDRFMGNYAAGNRSFWYYLPLIFKFSAPFSAFVPYAFLSPFYAVWERKRPVMWYLWLWFVVQILVMTISGGKRQHYILPVMPAFSILAGICLYDMIFELKAFKLKEIKILFAGHIIVAAVGAAGLLYWVFARERLFIWPSIHIALMLCLVLGLVIFLFLQKRKIVATAILFAGYCVILMTAYVYFINPFNYNNPSRSFSIKVGEIVGTDEELIAYNDVSARTIHYVGRSIPEVNDLTEVRSRYEKSVWVIATDDDYQDMVKAGGFEVVFYRQMTERSGQEDVKDALFHKSGGK